MDALNPNHANPLMRFNQDPATLAEGAASQELRKWFGESVHEALVPPVTHHETAGIGLFFSSVDSEELMSLFGAVTAAKWSEHPESQGIATTIDQALPSAVVVQENFEAFEQYVGEHKKLAAILKLRRGFLRAVTPLDNTDLRLSKGALHIPYPGHGEDTVFDLKEVPVADIALLSTHEILIRRLEAQPSNRFSALPFEYSTTRRLISREGRVFRDINEARRYVGDVALNGLVIPRTNELFQQGLLSMLQNCSLFPDVIEAFREGNREAFIAMQEKITQIWPTPGIHAPFAQCGFVFEPGLLHFDGKEVVVATRLQEALAELQSRAGQLDLSRELNVPLYVGDRTTVAFQPSDLPFSLDDARPIPGKLRTYGQASPFKERQFRRCPALGPVISKMAALLYDQAKTAECGFASSIPVTELGDEQLMQLTESAEFRARIPHDERQAWIEGDTDLIASGEFRSPELRGVYLAETAKPVLVQIGREAVRNAASAKSPWAEL
ncbi:MAG TPA: hypothetical protein VFO38_02405 [Candidatus Saccharimonadales bacterium]|nr:hypothetical protein [Candidatus Saccharimonadales bacterium]